MSQCNKWMHSAHTMACICVSVEIEQLQFMNMAGKASTARVANAQVEMTSVERACAQTMAECREHAYVCGSWYSMARHVMLRPIQSASEQSLSTGGARMWL